MLMNDSLTDDLAALAPEVDMVSARSGFDRRRSRGQRRTRGVIAAASCTIVLVGIGAVALVADRSDSGPLTEPSAPTPTGPTATTALGPTSSTTSVDTTAPTPSEPPVAVYSQADLMRVAGDVAAEEHVEVTAAGSGTWQVAGWTGRTIGLPSVWCLSISNGGSSCRTDGEEMDDELKQLIFEAEGTIVLADVSVASVNASADGQPVEVDLVDIGLPSGRKLVAVSFEGLADELVLTGLDAAGKTIATVVHDAAELRQADAQRATKTGEMEAAIELAMTAPPTILATEDSADSGDETWTIQVRVARTPSAAVACVETFESGNSCWEPAAAVDDDQGPRVVSYGGTPTSTFVVWSPTMLNGIEAVLTNGQALRAVATETDLGWFAAFAYPPLSPPQSVLASTTEGPIDFRVEDFDQPMEFTADGLG
jgi:hypothetical protein